MEVFRDYFKNKTRFASLDDPKVKSQAAAVVSVFRLIKQRLAAAGYLSIVPCPWCLLHPQEIAVAKTQALDRFRFLANHGFHCSAHAEEFHGLLQLDSNMHFSCCHPDMFDGDSLPAMMAQLSLQED